MDLSKFDLENDLPIKFDGIFLNSAGAALQPKTVYDSVLSHLELETKLGGYDAATKQSILSDDLYQQASTLIGSKPEEIAFVDCATRGWNLIFHSLNLPENSTIITSKYEYGSNYINFFIAQKKYKINISILEEDENGDIDLSDLENKIDQNTSLIAITHIPTDNGIIAPVEQVGKLSKKYRIPFLLDACQSAGQVDIDVRKIGCDFLSVTGRKYLRGPRGTGFIYINREYLNKFNPIYLGILSSQWTHTNEMVHREDAKFFELWETSIANKIGLSKAIEYANSLGMRSIENRIKSLASYLRNSLKEISYIILTDKGINKGGIVTFYSKNHKSDVFVDILKQHKIITTYSTNNATGLEIGHKQLPSLVRASIHYFNNKKEIDGFVEILKKLENYLP